MPELANVKNPPGKAFRFRPCPQQNLHRRMHPSRRRQPQKRIRYRIAAQRPSQHTRNFIRPPEHPLRHHPAPQKVIPRRRHPFAKPAHQPDTLQHRLRILQQFHSVEKISRRHIAPAHRPPANDPPREAPARMKFQPLRQCRRPFIIPCRIPFRHRRVIHRKRRLFHSVEKSSRPPLELFHTVEKPHRPIRQLFHTVEKWFRRPFPAHHIQRPRTNRPRHHKEGLPVSKQQHAALKHVGDLVAPRPDGVAHTIHTNGRVRFQESASSRAFKATMVSSASVSNSSIRDCTGIISFTSPTVCPAISDPMSTSPSTTARRNAPIQ